MMAEIIHLPSAAGATQEDWSHFDMVLGLTADLLPVVSNNKATISPNSAIKDIGKLPSTYNGQRQVSGFASWTQHRADANDITKWSKERDYGICLQTRRVRAIDVDVTDAETASCIREFIAARFDFPARTRSNAAKFLLAFDLPGGEFTKRKFKTAHGIVEFLATGQQFIAVGTHPSGARYEWEGGLPDEFPVLTAEQFEQLWREFVAEFAIEDSSTSSSSVKASKLADVVSSDPVAQFILNTNLVKRMERDGRLHITCPFEDEHTSDSGDTATTYWPAHTGGYVNGHFHCLHAHCEHRNDQEFLDAIGYQPEAVFSEFEAIGDAPTSPADHDSVPLIDTTAPPKPQRFAVVPAGQFAQGKPPTWIIKGVLPQADLAVLFGESGSGKSFAAVDMAVDIAMGTTWRGKTVRKGRVVYIAAEGAGGFRNRLKAIAQQRGLNLADIPIGVIPDAPNMLEKTDALDVAKSIHAAGGADLVILDTWAQVTAGANENSGEDMGRALAHCKGIHRATGALVMLVHHSGKDSSKGARGWSGLRAAADVELEVLRNEDARSLTVTKLKDGEDGAEFAFRLENVVLGLDDDGEEITSCIVEHGQGTVARKKDKGPKGSIERLVVNVMRDLIGLGEPFVEVLDLKAAVANQIAFDPAEGKRDTRGQRIDRALDTLRDAGRIVVKGTTLGFAGETL